MSDGDYLSTATDVFQALFNKGPAQVAGLISHSAAPRPPVQSRLSRAGLRSPQRCGPAASTRRRQQGTFSVPEAPAEAPSHVHDRGAAVHRVRLWPHGKPRLAAGQVPLFPLSDGGAAFPHGPNPRWWSRCTCTGCFPTHHPRRGRNARDSPRGAAGGISSGRAQQCPEARHLLVLPGFRRGEYCWYHRRAHAPAPPMPVCILSSHGSFRNFLSSLSLFAARAPLQVSHLCFAVPAGPVREGAVDIFTLFTCLSQMSGMLSSSAAYVGLYGRHVRGQKNALDQ